MWSRTWTVPWWMSSLPIRTSRFGSPASNCSRIRTVPRWPSWQCRFNGRLQPVIYKRFRVTCWTDPWTALVRRTPALRSWINGQGLHERDLPTARPLAVLHRRRHGLCREGYLLMEKIPNAVDLRTALDNLAGRPPMRTIAPYCSPWSSAWLA